MEGGKDVPVGESQVDGARRVGACEGKTGVDAGGVEEGEAQVCGSVEVGGGFSFFFRGKEPGRVSRCVVDVAVTCD